MKKLLESLKIFSQVDAIFTRLLSSSGIVFNKEILANNALLKQLNRIQKEKIPGLESVISKSLDLSKSQV